MNPRRLRRNDTAVPAVPPTLADPPRAIPSVPGFRLVRQLGAGARCDVFLAVPAIVPVRLEAGADAARSEQSSEQPGEERGEQQGEQQSEQQSEQQGEPVVLKLGRIDSAGDRLLIEADALSRLRHPHVLRLLDVAQVTRPAPSLRATASCLVLERLPRDSLSALLQSRSELRIGEAITILAPIAGAVEALHRSGVAHGALSASAVLFRASGAPVLARFGAATVFPAGLSAAALDSRAEVLVDRAALVRLVTVVLARVPDNDLPGVVDGLGELGPAAIADRLFTLGVPEPVDFVPRLDKLDKIDDQVSMSTGRRGSPGRVALGRASLAAGVLRSGADGPSDGGGAAVFALALRGLEVARRFAGTVRPRFWITAALVGLALVVALLAVPGTAGEETPESTSDPSKSAGPAATTQDPVTDADDIPVPAVLSAAIRGDDPVAALEALLEQRATCYAQLSMECLITVDQAGSAALATDSSAVRSVQQGGESGVLAPGSAATLVQELGDSALVQVAPPAKPAGADSKPASILVMRTEAGWRIRDYLEE